MNSLIDSKFATSTHMHDKPLSTEELMECVEKDSSELRGKFRKNGFITSDDFKFITYANFHEEKNCSLDENYCNWILKTVEESELAKQNLRSIETYLKECMPNRDISLEFYHAQNEQCALVNVKRNFGMKIEDALWKYFNQ